MCLSLAACNDPSHTSAAPGSGPTNPLKNPGSTGLEASDSENTQVMGTSSGGGGFADGYAMETLDLAKYALAQMIKNTGEDVFSKFPKEKNKEWMVKIIENISYEDVEESRYDRPLKFNYDLKKERIYATKYFSSTFPYGRFKTRSSKEKLQVLNEVMLDILHELSHFYEIGNTEKTDDTSDEWAYDFLGKGLNEVYHCQKGKDITSIHAPSGMAFVPLKDEHHVYAEKPKEELSPIVLSKEFDKYIEGYAGLSFFGIDNEETSEIQESEETQVEALINLALSNKSNTSVRLSKYKRKKEKNSLTFEEIKNPNFKGLFSFSSGSGAGSLYLFDRTDITPIESRFVFTYDDFAIWADDELVIWGEGERRLFPLATEEVISISKGDDEAKHVISILDSDKAQLDNHLKEKLNNSPSKQLSEIKCIHQFEVMDNSEYK